MASFWKPETYGQTVLPDRSILNRTKIDGKCQNSKIQMRHFKQVSNNVSRLQIPKNHENFFKKMPDWFYGL